MTQRGFPFDAGAGLAYELDWSLMACQWLTTGVIDNLLNELQVYADSTGMQVKVRTGHAWVRGHYYYTDAEVILGIATSNPSNPRIDRVVIRIDYSANTIVLAILTGTPATSPTAPALTQTDAIYEFVLGDILVGAAVGTIAAGNVTDQRVFATANVADNQIVGAKFLNADITFPKGIIPGVSTISAGKIYTDVAQGLIISGKTGSNADFLIATPTGAAILDVPTGSINIRVYGTILFSPTNDTNLYRSQATILKTDGSFYAAGTIASYIGLGAQLTFGDLSSGIATIWFGLAADTNLYRPSANILQTDDNFQAIGYVNAAAGIAARIQIGALGPSAESGILFGSANDTNLYRGQASVLQTDDALNVNGFLVRAGLTVAGHTGGVEILYTAGICYVQSYNRAGGTYLPLQLNGSTVTISSSGNSITFIGNTALTGNLTITGAIGVSVNGSSLASTTITTLTVSGTTILTGAVTVTNITGPTTVTGNLTVTNIHTVHILTVNTNATISGTATISTLVTTAITGPTTLTGNFTVSGAITASTNGSSLASTTITSLTVSGTTTLTGVVTTGTINASNITASGTVVSSTNGSSFASTTITALTVSGTTVLTGAVTVTAITGPTTLTGALTVGSVIFSIPVSPNPVFTNVASGTVGAFGSFVNDGGTMYVGIDNYAGTITGGTHRGMLWYTGTQIVIGTASTIRMTIAAGIVCFVPVSITAALTLNGGAEVFSTNNALTSYNSSNTPILGANSPVVGAPTKWIKIVDFGTARYIPTW